MLPDQEQNWQPSQVPQPEIKPVTVQYTEQHSNQLSHTSQGKAANVDPMNLTVAEMPRLVCLHYY